MRPSITPLEIRKRTFQSKFRGYDPVEVAQFLETMGDDLEELFRDLDELTRENTRLKEDNARYRENETTLKETLLLAQRSADGLKHSTEKEAGRIVQEAEKHAEKLIHQALERVAELERRIRELRVERKNFHLKYQGMIDMFQQVLNFDKEEDDLDSSVSILRSKRAATESA